jgi:hypothetical protein
MMRLAAVVLLAVLAALPVSVRPSAPPVAWLTAAALVVGASGVVAWSVPLVTAAGSLAVIAYALALVLARPEVDLVAPLALGAAFVLLLALAHLAARTRGAALAPSVVAAQARRWVTAVGVGVGAAVVLVAVAGPLGGALRSATLPVVVVASALGALTAVAGLVALVAARAPGETGTSSDPRLPW